MICLTGDVHHCTLKGIQDLPYLEGTEIESAAKMAEIAMLFGLHITLFFTGLCCKESPELVNQIASMENVEIGGHNYFAFERRKLFNLSFKLLGLRNGPYWYQYWEVRRTVRVLEMYARHPLRSWRDHCFYHDRNTRRILKMNKIRYFSDVLSKDFAQPVWNQGIIDVPINTLPDHDYVYHGSRQPGTFDESALLLTTFQTKAMTKEEWLQRIKREVKHIESQGGIATILTHPACMEVFDDFGTFRNLCSFLSKYESCKMRDIQVDAKG